MAWQPSPENLRQLATCLKDSLSGFDRNAQKQAELMLQQAKSSPDINNYLAYILSNSTPPEALQCSQQDYHTARSAASIMLKNNVRTGWKSMPETSQELVKMAVPVGLQDNNTQIRNLTGNIATEIMKWAGVLGWPELLPALISMFTNASGQVSSQAQEGAIGAMAKICEDSRKHLVREVNGERPLNHVLPQLINATKSPLPKVRVTALTAINVFTPRSLQAMLNSIDDLLQQLFVLATDENIDVRRQVCRSFTHLVESRPDKLEPHIEGLVKYIITQQRGDDEELATEAAEFWLAVGEHDNLWKALGPYINDIIPVLLECMVYSGEDIAMLGGASDDEDEEDRAEDIKPQFAKKNLNRNIGKDKDAGAAEDDNGMGEDLEDGEVEDDDDEGDENPDEKWTLRKCSAAALDVFSRDFRGPVFEAILPYLAQNLKHAEWPSREAAVLALGAVAEGCMDTVTPHLPELVPYLLTLLEDEEPVVRQITCWTLGRYSAWSSALEDPAQKEQFFVPMMDGLLRKMLDKNKKVQEAGASAFANLEEKAGSSLEPYCGPIIQQFIRCMGKYKDKNMYILYDCIQTLAERVGSILARPEHVEQLMPALISQYNRISDDSREIFPLFECFSYVSLALGEAFLPYAENIFSRCVRIISTTLEQVMAAASNPGIDQPEKDFLVVSLDLLSAILQTLGAERAQALVKQSPQSLFELLGFCLEDVSDEVRQSGYALLGDSCKYLYPQLQPYIATIMPILLRQLDLDNVPDDEIDGTWGAVNNACWSAGEIALVHGKGISASVPELFQRLVELITNPRVSPGVSENATIAIGRLGIDHSEVLAPAVNTFAEEYSAIMRDVEHTDEKATSFKGFSMVVARNPQAMEKDLLKYFSAIARYKDIDLSSPLKQELRDIFQNVLNIYKQMIPSFDQFITQLSRKDLEKLRANYTV